MTNAEEIALISERHYGFTDPILSDGIVRTFIHKSCEPTKFISNMLSDMGDLIDVEFKFVKRRRNAELKFYEIPLIAYDPKYIGNAVHYDGKWNIYVKSDIGHLKEWIYLHEFGHFLGMEHPFDDSDGDVFAYRTTTNDTVMSYNYIPSFRWRFRKMDIDTITGMWVD